MDHNQPVSFISGTALAEIDTRIARLEAKNRKDKTNNIDKERLERMQEYLRTREVRGVYHWERPQEKHFGRAGHVHGC